MTRKIGVHLPGLNGLRFFAALFVLIGHVELVKSYLDLPNSYPFVERLNLGGIGVYFFFVLSGFLITYLLLTERESCGKISVRNFYIRRILRIWPLYFLLLIAGFFILPSFDFFKLMPYSFSKNFTCNLLLFIFILPNLAFSLFPPVAHIGQVWSIGVEEQFYLVWPWLIKKATNVGRLTISLIFLYVLFKVIISLIPYLTKTGYGFFVFSRFFAMSKFECMLIGCYGAVVAYEKREFWMKIFTNRIIEVCSYLVFPVISFASGTNGIIQDSIHLPMSICFLVIIINVSFNKNSLLKFETKWLDHLGKISYGIYMYHFVVIFICIKLSRNFFATEPVVTNVVVYLLSFVFTLVISHISYRFFEKPFIDLKSRFSSIISG